MKKVLVLTSLALFVAAFFPGAVLSDDFGDAPDQNYQTYLKSNGASHVIIEGFFLGNTVDSEEDGQPDATATGDDLQGSDDEDGVTFDSPIVPGQPAYITVVASRVGLLDAWVDFNKDRDWADTGEQIFVSRTLGQGPNYLSFPVPATIRPAETFARFRLSSRGDLPFYGPAQDGEVEDYLVVIREEGSDVLDYGDAPEAVGAPGYPTKKINNGASHVIRGPWLGDDENIPDPEADGQPDPDALGDDNTGNDDEDGVQFSALAQGRPGNITVAVNGGGGVLEAWIDFNGDRTWQHPGERIFAGFLPDGTHSISVTVPVDSIVGKTFARFRISDTGGLLPVGPATNGEVEDHEVNIRETFLEIDFFYEWQAEFELTMPGGSTAETIQVKGELEEHVFFEGGDGEAIDDDGDMLDEVQTEIAGMNLTGYSPTLGPVTVQENPSLLSTGEIEETNNITSGWLDVPPLASSGTADSFFDVFVEITVGGQVLHNVEPLRISALITHKPPQGDTVYRCPSPLTVRLFDENNEPTEILLGCGPHHPVPTIEVDQFDFSIGQLELVRPDGSTEIVAVSGPATVHVYFEGEQEGDAQDHDGNGRDEVQTAMVALNLTGMSPTLGQINVRMHPTIPSLGEIEEMVNNTPGVLDLPPFTSDGTADSFFDLFFEVEVPDLGRTFYTQDPKRMRSVITHKPPGPGALYENLEDIPLYDASGQFTGFSLGATRHRPQPPVEIDVFDFSIGQLELGLPDGRTEIVPVSGPTTVHVYFEGEREGDALDHDNNGRDEVQTEIVALNLTGTSPTLGTINVRMHSTIPSLGGIEETDNITPGVLDLPPFTSGESGTADSFFDVYVEVEVPGQERTLQTLDPKRMRSVISHKPPGPDAIYENPDRTLLYDDNNEPTGFYLGATWHQPNPCVGDFDNDGDVDGFDLANFPENRTGVELEDFVKYFGRTDCR